LASAPSPAPNAGGAATAGSTVPLAPANQLPTPASPRLDGKPTLVWFHKFECPPCEEMERFAPETLDRYANRLAQIDLDVEDDAAIARRFHVIGAPSFVLLDATGHELTRFFYEPTPTRLESHILPFLRSA
jgi:thiol-disulfide isomerase/thioredoxin